MTLRWLMTTLGCGWVAAGWFCAEQALAGAPTEVPPMCTFLEHIANADAAALDRVTLAGRPKSDTRLPLPAGVLAENVTYRDRIDVDNNGVIDTVHIVRATEGASLFIGDHDLASFGVAADQGDFWKDAGRSHADALRLLRYSDKVYFAAFVSDQLRYVAVIDHGVRRRMCEFEQQAATEGTVTAALSVYQSIERSAIAKKLDIWRYALSQDDMAVANSVLENGASVDDTVNGMPILSWATSQNLDTAVDWLTEHGADVRAGKTPNDTPLGQALAQKNADLAVRFLRLGADPAPFTAAIAWFANARPGSGGEVASAAAAALHAIPESFVTVATRRSPALLDEFLQSEWPIQATARYWRNGVSTPVSPLLERELREVKDAGLAEKVQQLFSTRNVIAPKGQNAVVSYGRAEQGVEIMRARWSQVSDAELALFATSICVHFVGAECGPDELLSKAAAWAEQLPYTCTGELAAMGPVACKVATHYGILSALVADNAVRISVTRSGSNEARILAVADLSKLQAENAAVLRAAR